MPDIACTRFLHHFVSPLHDLTLETGTMETGGIVY